MGIETRQEEGPFTNPAPSWTLRRSLHVPRTTPIIPCRARGHCFEAQRTLPGAPSTRIVGLWSVVVPEEAKRLRTAPLCFSIPFSTPAHSCVIAPCAGVNMRRFWRRIVCDMSIEPLKQCRLPQSAIAMKTTRPAQDLCQRYLGRRLEGC